MRKINWLDLAIAVVLLIYIILGFRDGLIKQLLTLLGLVISLVVAFYASGPVGTFILDMFSPVRNADAGSLVGTVIAFIIIFVLLQFTVRFVAEKMRMVNYIPLIGIFNMIGGVIVGLLKAFIFLFIIVAVLSILPYEVMGDVVANSALANLISSIFPEFLGEASDFIREHYTLIIER